MTRLHASRAPVRNPAAIATCTRHLCKCQERAYGFALPSEHTHRHGSASPCIEVRRVPRAVPSLPRGRTSCERHSSRAASQPASSLWRPRVAPASRHPHLNRRQACRSSRRRHRRRPATLPLRRARRRRRIHRIRQRRHHRRLLRHQHHHRDLHLRRDPGLRRDLHPRQRRFPLAWPWHSHRRARAHICASGGIP